MNGSRTTTDIDYDDNDGIANAADDADVRIAAAFAAGNNGADVTRNIGIGHSLGGVVLRQIDRNEDGFATTNKTINGIITVGSPNYGAGMADAVANGNLQSVMTDGCNRLAAGPLSTPLLSPIVFFANINGFNRNDLCDFLYDQFLVNEIPNANSPTLQDLRLTGDYMANPTNGLNQFQSQLPRISIWGNENSPVHWRLASSFLSNATDDVAIVTVANQFRDYYNNQFIYNTSAAVGMTAIGFLNPFAFAAVPMFAYRSVQWKKGQDWFDNSESIWNATILCPASTTMTIVEDVYLADNCDIYSTGSPNWVTCIQHWCNSDLMNCTQSQTTYQTIHINHASDGLVCVNSQVLNDIDPNTNVYEAVGVNHRDQTDTRAMQNNAGPNGQPIDVMRVIFNEIWDRDQTDFFNTPN